MFPFGKTERTTFRPIFNFPPNQMMPQKFFQMADEIVSIPNSYNGSFNSNYGSTDGDNFIPKFILNGTDGDRELILQILKIVVPERLMPVAILDDPKFYKGNFSCIIKTSNEGFTMEYQFQLSDQLIQALKKIKNKAGTNSQVQNVKPDNQLFPGVVLTEEMENVENIVNTTPEVTTELTTENSKGPDPTLQSTKTDESAEKTTLESSNKSSEESSQESSEESEEESESQSDESKETDEIFEKYLLKIREIGKKYSMKIKEFEDKFKE